MHKITFGRGGLSSDAEHAATVAKIAIRLQIVMATKLSVDLFMKTHPVGNRHELVATDQSTVNPAGPQTTAVSQSDQKTP
jgi:hypothetical protein